MTQESKEQALSLLKMDLGITATAYDNNLNGQIDRAAAAIEREGITLSEENPIEDIMLVVQFAAYLWRSRKGEDTGMPRSLRYELNNRFVKQNADTEE